MDKQVSSSLSRRTFLKAGAFAVGGAVLAACAAPAAGPAGQAGASQPAAATKTLRLAAWGDVQDADVYNAILKVWNEKQKDGYTATVEQYPGGYYEKVQANFAAGSPAEGKGATGPAASCATAAPAHTVMIVALQSRQVFFQP